MMLLPISTKFINFPPISAKFMDFPLFSLFGLIYILFAPPILTMLLSHIMFYMYWTPLRQCMVPLWDLCEKFFSLLHVLKKNSQGRITGLCPKEDLNKPMPFSCRVCHLPCLALLKFLCLWFPLMSYNSDDVKRKRKQKWFPENDGNIEMGT